MIKMFFISHLILNLLLKNNTANLPKAYLKGNGELYIDMYYHCLYLQKDNITGKGGRKVVK